MMADAETAEALEGSIAHWEKNVVATDVLDTDLSGDACALCNLFNREDQDEGTECEGCPVANKAGQRFCWGTPYKEATSARRRWLRDASVGDAFRAAAQAERDFLISLREPVEAPS